MSGNLNPAKYNDKSATELRGLLLRRDSAEQNSRSKEQVKAGRTRRMTATAVSSAVLEVLENKFPSLKSFGGLPIGLGHVVAVGGILGSFYFSDEGDDDTADLCEGASTAAAVPLLRGLTAKAMTAASALV